MSSKGGAKGFREPPRPNFDYDIGLLVNAYEDALRNIQAELNSLFLTDFERAQIVAVEENIRAILNDLRAYSNGWAAEAIPRASREGIAATLYTLGLAETIEEAYRIAKFNGLNRELVRAIVADTQADLLAVTQNVERKTRAAVRQATADVMRAKTTTGINGTQSLTDALTKELRARLGKAADTSIIDSAGRRWRLKPYVEVVVRSKMMEAHIESTVNEGIDRGINYVIVSRHHGTCGKCAPWEGRVLAINPENTGGFPTLDEARESGLMHPMCKHVITTVSRLDRLPDDLRELNEIAS